MDAVTGKVALKILRDLKAREAEYREDKEAWYRSGDGRSPKWVTKTRKDGSTRHVNMGGKGYSYPYCIHGSSNWTDYDNICGRCEDGDSVYQIAVGEARERVAKTNERINWLIDAPAALRHTEMHRELLEWALQPIK